MHVNALDGRDHQSLSGQVLQSVSANPMCDLAYNPEVIKKRLSGIPVYVVVNQKNEFVLVSSDNDTRQLGLFFFDIDDAQGLLDAVKKQDPHMGRLARVLQTSMDAVYDVAVMPREHSGTEDVTFRFMPAAAEVEAAIDLYHAANINQVSFEGVPLFQAEGLVVRGEEGNRYTPLFFSKHDLDVALSNAFLSRDSDAQASARAKLERAKSELDAAQKDVEAAEDAKAKRSAEKRRNGASSRVKKYEKDLADATAQRKAPRIDVGSLEQVIVEMEQDDKNQWGDVIFVRPGYASDVTASKKEMKGKK